MTQDPKPPQATPEPKLQAKIMEKVIRGERPVNPDKPGRRKRGKRVVE
jgi:hypothetical protein